MSSRFAVAVLLTLAAGGCVESSHTEHAYAPDAVFHTQIDACAIQHHCQALCVAVFDLGPNADVTECKILLRDAAGARVRVTYWGANGGWDSSVGYDGGGFVDDSGYDYGDDSGGDCSDGSCDGSDDGSGYDDGSGDSGSDSGSDSGDGGDSGSTDSGGDSGGGDDSSSFTGPGHAVGHGTRPDRPAQVRATRTR